MKRKCVRWLFGALCLLLLGRGDGRAVVNDLRSLSQNPLTYCDPASADRPLLSVERQQRLNAEQDQLYFAPWHRDSPKHTQEQVTWGFRTYGADPGYDRAGKRHSAQWIQVLAANAHLEDYPQGGYPAILVKRADFRVLPTKKVHSRYRDLADGYAFDNLQESSEPVGKPILVTQVSRDKKWILVETSATLGWIPVDAAARVNAEFMRQWENCKTLVLVRDDVPVRDEKGDLCFEAPLGSLLPKAGEGKDRIRVWTPLRDGQGMARLHTAWLDKKAVHEKPLPFSARQVARVASALVGEPYRWGGIDGQRDCSALIQDLFAPFGLWLPRNSREQAGAGHFVNFKGLSRAAKEATILRQGIPWRTLLWSPGHIMLYIGAPQGRPLIFHNFWSVKTRDRAGNRGRIVVGRAAITTLQPGWERDDLDLPRADFLHGLGGMTLLGETPEPGAGPPEAIP